MNVKGGFLEFPLAFQHPPLGIELQEVRGRHLAPVQPIAVEQKALAIRRHHAEMVADPLVEVHAHREPEGRGEIYPHEFHRTDYSVGCVNFPRLFDQLIMPFLLVFLFIGSVGGFALGCALLLRAAPAIRFIESMNRWVSTRKATKGIEIQRQGFGRSKLLGVFLVAGGALACYLLIFRLQIPRSALSIGDPRFVKAFAIDSARWILVFGSVVSIGMGVLVLFLPRALDALEARVNRWVSTRNVLPIGGDDMKTPLDRLVEAYPRASGLAIAISSLVAAIAIGLLTAARWLR